MEKLLDADFLFASLIWGSVGAGYFIYGKKQAAMMPMIGGVVLIAVSYLVTNWLLMSFLSIATMVGVFLAMKRGY